MVKIQILFSIQILFISTLLFFWVPAKSQVKDATFYTQYVRGDMDAWKNALDLKLTDNAQPSSELIFILYGYTGYALQKGNTKEAGKYLSQLDNWVDKQLKTEPQNANWLAMKGACLGMHISLSAWKAPTYGRKSMSFNQKALDADSTNAYARLEKATLTYNMPSLFGGGLPNALPHLEKAVALFENRDTKNNWLYLMAKTNLALWYIEGNQSDKALQVYNELLNFEPNDKRIQTELQPKLETQK